MIFGGMILGMDDMHLQTGAFPLESLSGLNKNWCPPWTGITVRFDLDIRKNGKPRSRDAQNALLLHFNVLSKQD